MEIIIACFLGGWFILAGVVSTVAVCKSYKVKDEENEDKGEGK